MIGQLQGLSPPIGHARNSANHINNELFPQIVGSKEGNYS